MAESLFSPGVQQREQDNTFLPPASIEGGAAFIGPTVKGPVENPTVVSSYAEYQTLFGTTFESGSNKEEFLTSVAVRNYFQQGGTAALVTRVVSGSFTAASNTFISASAKASTQPFELATIGEGSLLNNATSALHPADVSASVSYINSDGSLKSGSVENFRWEISNINNTEGTFTLSIRRGDDSNNNKVILEQFAGVSLDPNSPDYIESRVGNQSTTVVTEGSDTYVRKDGDYANKSRYVRVSAVNLRTLNYLDNDGVTVKEDSAGVSYSGSLPVAQSGSFYNATGDVAAGSDSYFDNIGTETQGLVGDNYTTAINILNNVDDYRFKMIAAPGLNYADHPSQVDALISIAEDRGDAIAIVDLVRKGTTLASVIENASSINSSYAATYWPWLQTRSSTGRNEYVPASTLIPGVLAFTDSSSAPWFAPAGFTRGGLPTAIQAERALKTSQRNDLYTNNVNPIATFPEAGLVVYGQKTLFKKNSALDRVNVRRLLIELKEFIGNQARNLVFDQNSITTRNNFLSVVNPYLESVVQRQGLFAFEVTVDETNNTADVIDRQQLVGKITLQPTRIAEYIILDYSLEPTGATFG